MQTIEYLQDYWWLLISVLGGALVFLLFVLGGQSMLLCRNNATDRTMMVNALGRKWELTFTTLVVFGGRFLRLLPSFLLHQLRRSLLALDADPFQLYLQAVSYEFRSKPGNIFGTRTYDTFLFINGCVGCVLLGVAVAMMFFGAHFDVVKTNILDSASPVISTWAPSHGFEAIFEEKPRYGSQCVPGPAPGICSYFINCIANDAESSNASAGRC